MSDQLSLFVDRISLQISVGFRKNNIDLSAYKWNHNIVFLLFAVCCLYFFARNIPQSLRKADSVLMDSCTHNIETCLYRQVIYRGSIALVCNSMVLLVHYTFQGTTKQWNLVVASFFTVGVFAASCICLDEASVSYFLYFSHTASCLWLFLQGVYVIDMANNVHRHVLTRARVAEMEHDGPTALSWFGIHLSISAVLLYLVCWVLHSGYNYYYYCAPTNSAKCVFVNQLALNVTVVVGVILSVISMLTVVNKGLLVPLMLFLYTSLVCIIAVQSHTGNSSRISGDGVGAFRHSCPPTDLLSSFMSFIFLCNMIFSMKAADKGRPSPNVLENPSERSPLLNNGSVNSTTNATEEEESFSFYLLLVVSSSYLAMLLTSWGKGDGSCLPLADGDSVMSLNMVAEVVLWLVYVSSVISAALEHAAITIAPVPTPSAEAPAPSVV